MRDEVFQAIVIGLFCALIGVLGWLLYANSVTTTVARERAFLGCVAAVSTTEAVRACQDAIEAIK